MISGIFRETYRKVPCITVLEGATIEMRDCKLKGDTTNDACTAGVVSIDANVSIQGCHFQHFKSGGIMVQARPQNIVNIKNNEIISCDTNGIYVQGRQSRPVIEGNLVNFCRCAAISTNLDVQANVSVPLSALELCLRRLSTIDST